MTFEITDALPVVDRSTLERYATCPMQGRLTDTIVRSVDSIAQTGNQVHNAISELVSFYVAEFDKFANRAELTEYLMTRARESRPDVQPDVLRALWPSRWGIVGYIAGLAPKNILAFDGGEGERSGQLAIDLETVPIRATAEVDFLHATDSKQVVQELDWKSGHKYWTEADVAASFQFQMHAVLVLHKYPEVDCVRTSIWNTRTNSVTYAVEFTRERLPEYRMRVETAASEWYRWNVLQKDATPPAWPARDKCDKCDCVALCPAVDRDLATDPKEQLAQLVLLDTRVKAAKSRLSEHVKASGRDVKLDDGTCFGWFEKPASSRKPVAAVYQAGKDDE